MFHSGCSTESVLSLHHCMMIFGKPCCGAVQFVQWAYVLHSGAFTLGLIGPFISSTFSEPTTYRVLVLHSTDTLYGIVTLICSDSQCNFVEFDQSRNWRINHWINHHCASSPGLAAEHTVLTVVKLGDTNSPSGKPEVDSSLSLFTIHNTKSKTNFFCMYINY